VTSALLGAEEVMTVVTVFLVDDHEVVRRGVAELLNEEEDLTVIGQASSVSEALARIPALRPDVAVLDIRLPDGNGVELCRELRSRLPDLNCLMLTSFTDEQAMMDAILAGAGGYVIKDIKGMDLISAVRTVGAGHSLLDNRAAAALMSRLRDNVEKPGPLTDLTEQEHTVLDLIGEGLTNRQIAERMFLSEKTVKNYVSRLLSKLGMERRTQAAVLVTELRDRTYRSSTSN
jgi:two-component system response regulator DevR